MTLPQLFKRAGYAVGRVGKVFHVADSEATVDVLRGAALAKDQNILSESKLAEASEGDLSDPPRVRGKSRLYNRNYGASKRPDRDFTDYQIADDAIATLEKFRARPFFSRWASSEIWHPTTFFEFFEVFHERAGLHD